MGADVPASTNGPSDNYTSGQPDTADVCGDDRLTIRPARPGEQSAVRGVLTAGNLAIDHLDIAAWVDAGSILVAIDEGPPLGVVVVVPRPAATNWPSAIEVDAVIDAVAVRRGRRGQGIGTALIEAVVSRLTVEECCSDRRDAAGIGELTRRQRTSPATGARASIPAQFPNEISRLGAAFAPELRPFYAAIGFEIKRDEGPLFGVLDVNGPPSADG